MLAGHELGVAALGDSRVVGYGIDVEREPDSLGFTATLLEPTVTLNEIQARPNSLVFSATLLAPTRQVDLSVAGSLGFTAAMQGASPALGATAQPLQFTATLQAGIERNLQRTPAALGFTSALQAGVVRSLSVFPAALAFTSTLQGATATVYATPASLGFESALLEPTRQLTVSVGSALQFTATLQTPAPLLVRLPGTLSFTATLLSPSPYVTTNVDGTLAFTASLLEPARLLERAVDGSLQAIFVLLAPTISGASTTTYTVYSINADSSAPVQYSNFEFDGFADMGNGVLYAVTNGSLYQIAGNDDDGANILSRVRTGLIPLDRRMLTKVDSVDVLADDDNLVLRTISEYNDAYEENWYEPHTQGFEQSNLMREHVFKRIGMGLHSRYWGFEINNQGGAAGEMDRSIVYPIPTSRRRK